MATRTKKYESRDGKAFATHAEASAYNRKLGGAIPIVGSSQPTGLSYDALAQGQSSIGADREALVQKAQAIKEGISAQPVQLTAANGFGSGVQSPYVSELDQLQINRYKDSQKPINREAIRKQKIAEFQAQIDATNQIFTNLTSQANVQGEGRLGQQRALAARSGNLQQPRGEAQKENVITYNNQITGDIAARQQSAIATIMTEAQDRADAEYAQKQQAKEMGAQSYLQYLQGAEERKATNAQAVLQSLLAQGLKLEDIPQEQFGQIANSLKMSPQELQSVYRGELSKAEAAQAQAEYERFVEDRKFGLEQDKFGFEQDKFGAEFGLNQQKFGFDIDKFNAEYELNKEKFGFDKDKFAAEYQRNLQNDANDAIYKNAQIAKIQAEIGEIESKGGGQLASDGTFIVNRQQAQKLNQDIAKSDAYKAITKSQDSAPVLAEFKKVFEESGGGVNLFGNNRAGVSAAYESAILNLKEFFNLGVLNGPDEKILRNILPSPNSIGTQFKGGGNAVSKGIENLEKMIKSTVEDRYRDITGQYQGYSPEQVTNLKEANRIYNQLTGNNEALNEARGIIGAPAGQYGPPNPNGGSSGTNPKAQSIQGNQSSSGLVDTKTFASMVLPKYPEGAKGGQCVTFLHKLVDFPPVGDTIQQKYASVDKFGIPKSQVPSQAKVGMILISNDNKTYGHGALINAISADGKYARVTESNYKGVEKVSHDRVIALDDPRIYGAIMPKKLKTIA
jgi:hypothetical protein